MFSIGPKAVTEQKAVDEASEETEASQSSS